MSPPSALTATSAPRTQKPTLQTSAKGSGFFFTQTGEEQEDDTRITLLIQRTQEEHASGAHKAIDLGAIGRATDACDVSGILQAGFDTFTPRSPQGLGVTTERDGWFLAYVASGRCDWFGRDHIYELRPGSLCLIPPGVPHGGFDHVIQTCRCYWAVIDPVKLAPCPAVAQDLKHQLGQVANVTFFGGLELEALFERLMGARNASDPLSKLQGGLTAMLLLTEAIKSESESMEMVRSKEEALPDLVKEATSAFSQDIASIPTVGHVARQCGISRGHLHRMFTEHLGVSPKAYVQELRLRRARDLLKEGSDVRTVARKVSLATAGELRRLFMQALDCQPEQWLARHARLWQSGEKLPGQAD